MQRSLAAGLLFLVLAAVPSVAVAQETGPTAGTWGAEGGFNTPISVLRFTSPRSAWILGVDADFVNIDEEPEGTFSFEETFTNVFVRLGMRRYRQPEQRFRPFTTLAGIVGYQDVSGSRWSFGGDLEFGGAWFFTPHVSLGSSLGLSAIYARGERNQPVVGETTITEIRANTNLRFLGSVYF